MLPLGETEVHIWEYATDPGVDRLAYAVSLLSAGERERWAAFRFDKHRAEYALSHALVRLALSEYAPVRAADWTFGVGEWGKPFIAGPVVHPPLWFNLSHTGGYVVCAVARMAVGVDVEQETRRADFAEVSQRFFAPGECEYLRGLPPELRRGAFFRIWTRKEAYIKADGRGLAVPLESFNVLDTAEYRFWEFQAAEHRIALAVADREGRIEVRRHDARRLFLAREDAFNTAVGDQPD